MDITRITDMFTKLVETDSISFGERQMADILTAELENLGFEVFEDDAGRNLGSDTGNLYAFLKGTDSSRKPVLLSAHMDTVVPGIGKKALIDHDKGIITSSGDTILGADDLAGVVQILEAVRTVIENGSPRGDIEILFTVAEEVYGKGAAAFDYSRIISDSAYVMDLSEGIGIAAVAAPSIISFAFEIHGRSAHAGFEPEAGINAIAVASQIISATPQGRLTDDITFNIGTISGGSISNIVSDSCICKGEVRGLDHEAACAVLDDLRNRIDRICAEAGAKYTFSSEVMIHAYRTDETSDVCRLFADVCRSIGLEPVFTSTRAGSDNNIFALHDLPGIVVGCGSRNTHTIDEYINLDDLYKGAELVEKLLTFPL